MIGHHLPNAGHCPSCDKLLDGATAAPGQSAAVDLTPKPGDVSVCVYCGCMMEFAEGGAVVELSMASAAEMDMETWARLCEARSAIIRYRAKFPAA